MDTNHTLPVQTLRRSLQNIQTEQAVRVYLKEVIKSDVAPAVFVLNHKDYPTLHTLKSEFGKTVVFELLLALLEGLITSLNVQAPTDIQIFEMANELIKDYPTYKPEDFKTFFTQAKKGQYGQLFNRFDIAILYTWIRIYDEERISIFENQKPIELEPVIRTNDFQKLSDIYKNAIDRGADEASQREQKKALRIQAREQWLNDFNTHFETHEKTQESESAYMRLYPFNESYINFFIQKNIRK